MNKFGPAEIAIGRQKVKEHFKEGEPFYFLMTMILDAVEETNNDYEKLKATNAELVKALEKLAQPTEERQISVHDNDFEPWVRAVASKALRRAGGGE